MVLIFFYSNKCLLLFIYNLSNELLILCKYRRIVSRPSQRHYTKSYDDDDEQSVGVFVKMTYLLLFRVYVAFDILNNNNCHDKVVASVSHFQTSNSIHSITKPCSFGDWGPSLEMCWKSCWLTEPNRTKLNNFNIWLS